MKRLMMILTVLFCTSVYGTHDAAAQTVVTGAAGGAYFRFAVPPNWNGSLVIWNDGLTLGPIVPFTVNPNAPLAGLGQLAPLQFSEGYALAVSSRRQIGWAAFKSNNDLHSMMDEFISRFGNPKSIFVTGGSFGGLIAIQAIESAHLGNVVGGMTLCGTLAGSRNWDLALDLRLAYDAVCRDVPGAAIPGGAEGLPEGLLLNISTLAARVGICAQQPAFANVLAVTQLPPSFLLTDMVYSTFVMSDLVHDRTKLNGKIGTRNETVDYGNPVINAAIERVSPNPGAEHRLEDNYTPTGNVGATRIVSLHTDKDGLSIVENESDYASKVSPANFTSAIAIEATPSHCGFNPAEVIAGWESLRGWVAGAPQPTPASIQLTCQAISSSPASPGPCRFNPAFVVPSIDGRIRPR
jgi:hypothetical protein